MLSERPYMQGDYPRRSTSALVWLIAATVAAFILQLVLASYRLGSDDTAVNRLTLTIRSLQNGHLWTLVTHALLHRIDQPFHVITTVLGLVFFGRELEPILGGRKLLILYGGAIVWGAIAWSAVHWLHGGYLQGPGAGILGLLVVLLCLYPEQHLRFLVLFLIPVTLRPSYLILGLLGLNIFALFHYEIPGVPAPFDYCASSHLGGMLAGWLYYRWFHASNGLDLPSGLRFPSWLRRNRSPRTNLSPRMPSSNVSPSDLRTEVDLILDKINSQGFGALTDAEKCTLDRAKDLLSRH